MKKRRLNITLDADAARKLTAYAKRMRIPLGRLLQDAALGVLLEDKAPEIPAEDRPSWAKRLMAAGTPAACRHNNGFRHLTLDLGELQDGVHLGERFDKTQSGDTTWLVSVRTGGRYGQKLLGTLHYRLLHDEKTTSDSEDALAPLLPKLHRDLQRLVAEETPSEMSLWSAES